MNRHFCHNEHSLKLYTERGVPRVDYHRGGTLESRWVFIKGSPGEREVCALAFFRDKHQEILESDKQLVKAAARAYLRLLDEKLGPLLVDGSCYPTHDMDGSYFVPAPSKQDEEIDRIHASLLDYVAERFGISGLVIDDEILEWSYIEDEKKGFDSWGHWHGENK